MLLCACVQVTAAAAVGAGLGLGIKLWEQLGGSGVTHLVKSHIIVGILVTALVLLQALAVILRPKPASRLRCCFTATSLEA
jgi:hypothetical protein